MILICYEGSEGAKHAIATAHELLGDVAATVVHVWEAPSTLLVPDPIGGLETWGASQVTDLEMVIRERAGGVLAEGVALASETGFEAAGQLERGAGSSWHAILDTADVIDAKLIVLGARGLSTVASVLLGSVSNAVVHHSKRPVLVVPALS